MPRCLENLVKNQVLSGGVRADAIVNHLHFNLKSVAALDETWIVSVDWNTVLSRRCGNEHCKRKFVHFIINK